MLARIRRDLFSSTISRVQTPQPNLEGKSVILYDGICGLCDRTVKFVLKNDREGKFLLAPRQGEFARAFLLRVGRDPGNMGSVILVRNPGTPAEFLLEKSDASLGIAETLGWPWKLATAARILPRAVRDFFYSLIARHRYQIFGKFDQCKIPTGDERARFLP